MLRQLTLYLETPVKTDPQDHDVLITIESYRDAIIKLVNSEPESIRAIVNHMEYTLPPVIYSKPYKDQIRIFGLGDQGALAINTIALLLNERQTIEIKNHSFRIKKVVRRDEIDFLPQAVNGQAIYTTLTPINVFTKKNHPAFLQMLMSTCNGPYHKATPEQQAEFNRLAKAFTLKEIRSFIVYYLKTVLGEGEYPFVEQIELDWLDFRVVHAKYHSQEMKMPMISGKFTSNYTLPKFIGYKIGKGFGELSLKRIDATGFLKCS